MKPAARIQSAIDVLIEIYTSHTAADAIAHSYMRERRYIGSGDRREIMELVYGVMRKFWYLEGLLNATFSNPGNDPIQSARRHVLAYLIKINNEKNIEEIFSGEEYAPKHLNAAEAALAEKLMTEQQIVVSEAAQLSAPDWVVAILQETNPETYQGILKALQKEASVDLRVNTLKNNRETVLHKLNKTGTKCVITPTSPWGIRLNERSPLTQHPLMKDGSIEIQDEGSQLIAQLCNPQPGMAVWDYCAGAGGKTLALAAMMNNKGRIIASDTVAWRLKNAPQRLRRAGVHNVETRVLDEESAKWVKRQAGKFDCVLVDAPCTGSGTWRRNPELRWRMDEAGLHELVAKQQNILEKAANLVAPGGRLVFATCSILRPEGRGQIETFLAKHPDFRLEEDKILELNPFEHGTDGFFAAAMTKISKA